MTVANIAHAAAVSCDTVRYYTKCGLLRPERDETNNYRLYGSSDLRHLLFVRRAKTLGYTLDETRQLLEACDDGRSPCPAARNIISRRVEENRKRLDALNRLQTRMETALRQWETMPDGIPDGDSICHLIESATADLDGDE